MTLNELKKLTDKDGWIVAEMTVDMEDLLLGNVETLNDKADEEILGDLRGSLSDISYRIIGHTPGSKNDASCFTGSVLLEVTADVNNVITENEEEKA